MKGMVTVDTPEAYQAWLKEQAELAGTQNAPPATQQPPNAPAGPTPGNVSPPGAPENTKHGGSNAGNCSAAGRAETAESGRPTRTKAGPTWAKSERRVIACVAALYARRFNRGIGKRFGGHRPPLQQMAQPLRVVHRVRDPVVDLQRRNGDEQRRWTRRARLADHVWLQHVLVSRFKMDRWSFL